MNTLKDITTMFTKSVNDCLEMQKNYLSNFEKTMFSKDALKNLTDSFAGMNQFQLDKNQTSKMSKDFLLGVVSNIDLIIDKGLTIENKKEIIKDFESKKYGEMSLNQAIIDMMKDSMSSSSIEINDKSGVVSFDMKESMGKSNSIFLNNLLMTKEAALRKLAEIERSEIAA